MATLFAQGIAVARQTHMVVIKNYCGDQLLGAARVAGFIECTLAPASESLFLAGFRNIGCGLEAISAGMDRIAHRLFSQKIERIDDRQNYDISRDSVIPTASNLRHSKRSYVQAR